MHFWRERNQYADFLAKRAVDIENIQILQQPPEGLGKLLNRDEAEFSTPKLCA